MSDDREDIRRLLQAREAAIATSDAKAAVAPIAEGAVTYELPPPLEYHNEPAGAEAGLRRWFETWEKGVTSELADPTIIVSGDLAVVFGLARMRGHKKDQGPTDMWFRSTIALQRGVDGWRIVHEHSSVPLAMDGSGRAETDLTPE